MDCETGYVSYGQRGGSGELRLAPATYGAGGRGARIAFTSAETSLGGILIAATATGVCWLGIHDDRGYLEEQLRGNFPLAQIEHNASGMSDFARQAAAYMDGAPIMLPLDIRATPFCASVWRELCAIPFGATRSYGEIARRIGGRNASRAVGHANGSNPIAVVIPCHRVVGSDGSLTGYRWGIEYKRRLLAREAELARQWHSEARSGAENRPDKDRQGVA